MSQETGDMSSKKEETVKGVVIKCGAIIDTSAPLEVEICLLFSLASANSASVGGIIKGTGVSSTEMCVWLSGSYRSMEMMVLLSFGHPEGDKPGLNLNSFLSQRIVLASGNPQNGVGLDVDEKGL